MSFTHRPKRSLRRQRTRHALASAALEYRRRDEGGESGALLYPWRSRPKPGRAKSADFMLHATVSSVETKSSWVVASMILVVMAVARRLKGEARARRDRLAAATPEY